MKKSIPYFLVAVCAIALGGVCVKNHALRANLAKAEAELAELRSAPAVVVAPTQVLKPERQPRTIQPKPAPSAPETDGPALEKVVEERVEKRLEEIRREREAEREARRREWENMTDEQRAARRAEFQARMQEHASARLTEFIEKAELDENQCLALADELDLLDSRVREIAEAFAADINAGAPFSFETQMQLLNNVSSAVIDAYSGLDESLPEGWREKDGEFNVMFGIGPDAINPLMDAMHKKGMFGMGGFPFMGMPPRGPRHRGNGGRRGQPSE